MYERDGVTRFSGLTASPSVADSTGHVHLKLVNGFKFDNRVQTLINLTVWPFITFFVCFFHNALYLKMKICSFSWNFRRDVKELSYKYNNI